MTPTKSPFRSLPNLITAARLALVPVVVWAIAREAWGAAFLVFAAAGISDGIDGFLARRYAFASRLGAILDPLADKALMLAVLVGLTLAGLVPAWFPAVLVARDAVMVAGAGLARLAGRSLASPPLLVGKLNTACQIAFLAWLLGSRALGIAATGAEAVAMPALAGLSVVSALVQGVHALRGGDAGRDPGEPLS
ncbi:MULTISPECIES: CDP-alcohol phosphatidyltransferase family protein [Methylobacterium]|jgi:cardiolipin synthase|uniref:CDP-diacylglycerol--glycerol-3-phosphate 3-phosphatidyltransferase n=2 Tax=Methylobacterium TaxID=407 RepID=A0A0C6F5U7_9HYPH|nr:MULTISPECIES: CDP-alcohol phosphatidyltransferase family protein [Methylobacterium]MBK3396746.1 CDP-alcohol phosphatidyltransferase family protein [Methylobacterium ajmalii]MBK3407322.1 CDP-alcohol phosphatidyltransferase family protein [Methylobacterium ajmalii]MBK3424369.1 CDP-alcohol phosphatidyltransferase family protein [Methylobacterium ajmalii]MBZ6414049.1 CDP-alcohol phosphatidyltransferase family protein [Methylobacterium sp.]SFF34613.1 CDP-diacylglycerol--glycerol-3-phosphate 3-ph